jgi:outer membrane protein insertion porin family/translocation and assembly module TamA
MLTSSCAAIPKGRAAVDRVTLRGAEAVRERDVEAQLATTESPKFLGLFRGLVYDYSVFNRFVLERDLARVERYYKARGYYRARVRAGRIYYVERRHVHVEIIVEEGPPVRVGTLVLRGLTGLPKEVAQAARQALLARMRWGDVFEEEAFEAGERAVRRALTDRGYAYARVVRTAHVDVVKDVASVAYDVEADEPATFGAVRFEGLGSIPEAPARRTVALREGTRYSTQRLDDAEQALLDLGVFSSVVVEPDLADPRPSPRVIPIVVRVEPAKLRQVRLGVGAQLDSVRADVHGIIAWEHKNLGGGLRHFTAELRPGGVLYPTRLPSLEAPERVLPEERLRLRFRQPGFLEARTGGVARMEVNTYPVLLGTERDPEAPVLGYFEWVTSLGVDRHFGRHLYVNPSQNFQYNAPFTYLGRADRELSPLLISYPEFLVHLDYRDDRVSPREGVWFGVAAQLAGLGGDVRDFKLAPEARVHVPILPSVSLALRGATGLLFPGNYQEPARADSRGEWVRDAQILFFRGFFSGGPTSNRGYPSRGVGPHGPIPFFTPGTDADALRGECEEPGANTARCLLPTGGLSLWEASAELRAEVRGPLSAVAFCDASDVAPGQVEYRFDRPHLSCGPGLRYTTPVGPVRVDLGFRIPGAQTLGESTAEGDPPELFGRVPATVAFGIGEAF